MIFYALMLLLLPFLEYPRLPKIGEHFTIIKMIGILAVAAAAFRGAAVPRRLQLLRWTEFRLFIVYFLIAIVSDLTTGNQGTVALSTYISIASFYVATLILIDTPDRLRKSCIYLLVSTFVASLYVYNDFIRWHNPRPAGIVGDPNYYAMIALSMLPMSIAFARTGGFIQRAFLWCNTVSLCASTLLGGSRAGLLGLCVTLTYVIARSKRRWLVFGIAAFAMLVLLVVLPQSPLDRLMHGGYSVESSTNERERVLKFGIQMIRDHPMTGVGLGRFKDALSKYDPYNATLHIAHNTYVNIGAEMGIPAAIVFVVLLFVSWRRGRQLASIGRANGIILLEQVGTSVEIGIVSYCIAAIFLTADYIKHLWILIFLAIAGTRMAYEGVFGPIKEPLSKRARRAQTAPVPAAPAAARPRVSPALGPQPLTGRLGPDGQTRPAYASLRDRKQ